MAQLMLFAKHTCNDRLRGRGDDLLPLLLPWLDGIPLLGGGGGGGGGEKGRGGGGGGGGAGESNDASTSSAAKGTC